MYYVYILASLSGILYVGFTSNLKKRTWEHKQEIVEGFTKKYKCHRLVYFEVGEDKFAVLEREKQIKKYRREKKMKLVESVNPAWKDLYDTL